MKTVEFISRVLDEADKNGLILKSIGVKANVIRFRFSDRRNKCHLHFFRDLLEAKKIEETIRSEIETLVKRFKDTRDFDERNGT